MSNKVIVIAGQSNAVGRASESITPSIIDNYVFTRTKIYFDGAWVNYDPHTVQTHDQIAGDHGVDVYIAYQFEQDIRYENDTLYIIKYAEGGRPLADNGGRTWSPTVANNIYSEFVAFANSAYGSIVGGYTTLGFFWMQGETDSQVKAYADAYFANLTELFDTYMAVDIADALSGELVIGNISDAPFWTYRTTVWQGQKDYIETNQKSNLIDTTSYQFDPGDDGHYSAYSFNVMANDIYAIFTDAISSNQARQENINVIIVDENTGVTTIDEYEKLITRKAQIGDVIIDIRSGEEKISIKNKSGLAKTLMFEERGEWTPILGGSISESGQIYSANTTGRYIKNGSLVTCFFTIEMNNIGVIDGLSVIKNLPFTVSNNYASRGGTVEIGYFNEIGIPAIALNGFTEFNSKFAYLRYADVATVGDNTNYCPNNMFTNNSIIRGKITYGTDE